jgi:glycerol-3-phosphate dehydrogenase (NAD+)
MTTPNEERSNHAGSKKSIVDVKNSEDIENEQGNKSTENDQCNKNAENTQCNQTMDNGQNEEKHESQIENTHASQIKTNQTQTVEDKTLTGSTHASQTKSTQGSQTGDKIQPGSAQASQTKSIHGSQSADNKSHTESIHASRTKTTHESQTAEDKIQTGSTHASQTQSTDDKIQTENTHRASHTKSIHESRTKSMDDKIQIESTRGSQSNKSKSLTKSVDTSKTKSEDTLKTKSTDADRKSVETREMKTVDAKSYDSTLTEGSFQAKSAETFLTELSTATSTDQKRVKELKRVCVIGARNWGTLFAKIIGTNIVNLESFNNEVLLYVQEETINGKNLTDIINEKHENVKYLPGCQLPTNVVAVSDVVEAAREAHILVFTLLQEYIPDVCTALTGKIKPTAAALSLTKGFELTEDGNIDLFSQIITRILKIQTSVLMGANLCDEIASEKYCEATIGCKDKLLAAVLKELLQTEYLHVAVVDDVDGVEICGSLRNVIACGVGFIDGLDMGRGIKATVIRLGLIEMIKFIDIFYPASKISTFFESCGVADLATGFLAGRNREISEKFVLTELSITDIEKEMLGGYSLEGPATARKLNVMLRERDMEDRFPLFTNVAKIYAGELDPSLFLDNIIGNPEHVNIRLHHLTW